MDFSVTEKNNSIYVKILTPDPWRPQTFFPMIDQLNENIKQVYLKTHYPVTFDFLKLKFIDSYMISMLVQSARITAPQKNVLIVDDKQILSIVNLIGINKMYTVYKTIELWQKGKI